MDKATNTLAGLDIGPVEVTALWSVQGDRDTSLIDFETSLFGRKTGLDEIHGNDDQLLLRLWPHKIYLLSEDREIPRNIKPLACLMTDISDAYCSFQISGDHAYPFIKNYLSAKLAMQEPGCLRCKLGHYNVILYWQNPDQAQLLVERSYSCSLDDYIKSLIARWRPEQQ